LHAYSSSYSCIVEFVCKLLVNVVLYVDP
jgi:hypothetical protein